MTGLPSAAREVLSDLFDFAKEVLRSRAGRLLFLVHLALVSCAYAAQRAADPPPTGLFDQPLLVKVLYVVNLPTILAAAFAVSPLLYERTPDEYGPAQWLGASFVLFCVLFQWFLIGYLLERLWSRRG